jgi:hypothetical protein
MRQRIGRDLMFAAGGGIKGPRPYLFQLIPDVANCGVRSIPLPFVIPAKAGIQKSYSLVRLSKCRLFLT